MDIKELNEFMRDHGFCNTNNKEDLPKKYVCDLVQSALEEGRNKAIDDMKTAWDSRVKDLIKWCKDKRLSGLEQADLIFDEIAEELKGGAT